MIIKEEIFIVGIGVLGYFIGLLFSYFRWGKNFQKSGTIQVDMRDEARDICRLKLSIPLSDIAKQKYVIFKVEDLTDGNSRLESFRDYD